MARSTLGLLPLVLILACTGDDKDDSDDPIGNVDTGNDVVDYDQDGFPEEDDCDDNDPTIHPGASEICDNVDNNCDGLVDEEVTTTYYRDSDGDGFGDADNAQEACEAPTGYVPNGNDCDDSDVEAYPGNSEVCDLIDNDCDGEVDEDVSTTYYADSDVDGYGDPENSVDACSQPAGYVEDDQDCDDTTDQAFPGNLEICDEIDNDCDGSVDEDVTTTYYVDLDGDSWGDSGATEEACSLPTGYAKVAGDCDDTSADVNPDALEECDLIDNDCDGTTDEDDAIDVSTWYADTDGDSFGDAAVTDIDCYQPTGYVADDTDCDDSNPTTYPGADEYCDGHDDDCNGDIDEDDAVDVKTWYEDGDSDGFGEAASTDIDCYQPTGYVADDTDCDDDENTVYPGAAEVCDGQYNDCSDSDYDASSAPTDELDDDSDTYVDCTIDSGGWDGASSVTGGDDCDDAERTVYPGAAELCDGQYNDCDDTAYSATSAPTDELDDDGDTYVDCTIDSGGWDGSASVTGGDDCDDAEATVYPSAAELCDGQYNDCDDTAYSATSAPTDELDDDSDTFVDCTIDSGGWDGSASVTGGDDCDDAEITVYPGASEVCDGQYNDCNDSDYDASSAPDDELDDDGDAYVDCTIDSGGWDGSSGVTGGDDCDDADSYVYPTATEICDGQYNDCDDTAYSATSAPSDETDDDSDTYVECTIAGSGWVGSGSVTGGDDCDDAEDTVYPGAAEICDGQFNDCDDTDYSATSAPDDELDDDSDGYVDCTIDTTGWDGDSSVVDGDDCDDADADQYPGADEVCNSEDDDCDGDIDEDGEVIDGTTYYADTDSDDLGDADNTIEACSVPSGYVENAYDCNDSDSTEPMVADATGGSASGAGTDSDPFDSIQDAIDSADECVIAYAGTYKEVIDLDGKSIEIWGVEGADLTTIDGDGTVCSGSSPTGCEPVVTANSGSASAELIGFTITGGTGMVTSSSSSTTCADSSASYGGDNTCTVNTYEYWGGGVFVDGDDLTLTDCIIEDNNLPEFEQLAVGDFEQNWLYSYGGGIAVLDGSVSLDGTDIFENFADQGGGIYVTDSASVELVHTYVAENMAEDGAGAVVEDSASLTALNSIFACNDADTDGGGIFADSATVDLTNVVLAKDSSSTGSTHGAGIYSSSSTVTMWNSIVWTSVSAYGIYGSGTGTFDYNDVYNSSTSSYTFGGGFTAGSNGISSDPDLGSVSCDGNPSNDDFTLDSTSPAIDAGDPSSAYDDTDGTTNDMGAYGGPNGSW